MMLSMIVKIHHLTSVVTTIKYSELDHSVKIGDYVKTKGYDLIVNLMGITLLTDTQIYDFVNVMSGLDPLVLYFADSYGLNDLIEQKKLLNYLKVIQRLGFIHMTTLVLHSFIIAKESEGSFGWMVLYLEWVEELEM